MSINLGNLELTLIQKINSSTSPLEIQTYTKALEKIRNGMIYSIDTFSSLPEASQNDGKLYYVQDEETVYWAYASIGWITLETLSTSSAFSAGRGEHAARGSGSICFSGYDQELSLSSNWNSAFIGGISGAGIKSDGTLWTWGQSECGNLMSTAVAVSSQRSSPVQELTSSSNWCVAMTTNTWPLTLAIKTDGSLWGAGRNCQGELMQNTTNLGVGGTGISSPVQEYTSSTNWCDVSGGSQFTNAIKTDGTLWGAGVNNYGQLGTGDAICRSSPTQEITSSSSWCAVVSADYHALSIKTDGTIWSWGYGFYGRIGNSCTVNISSPAQEITSSINWSSIGIQDSSSTGIKSDGTLWSWGQNTYGNLGTNSTTHVSSPVQEITSSTNWCYTAKSSNINFAIKTTGHLWVLGGYNRCGLLGDGGTCAAVNACVSSPFAHPCGWDDWSTISGGTQSSIGIRNTVF